MSEQKMIKRAKVTLKGAKSYTVAGRKFIKDTPTIIKGSLVEELRTNGRFKFTELEAKPAKRKKSSSSDEGAVSKKKSKKKASKKTSKKVSKK